MRYQAYGVTLDSAVALPELALGDDAARDVVKIRVDDRPAPSGGERIVYAHTNADIPALECARCDGGYVQKYSSKWPFFLRSDGMEIVAHQPLPAAATLRHLLLDSVLPHALNLAGKDSLHATAVLTARGVVAFMGPSGAGKSTLAARFLSRGMTLVSDDCLVVTLLGGAVMAVPSYSGLRLLPDAVAWMGLPLHETTPVADYGPKRRIVGTRAPAGGCVVAIYVLASATCEMSSANVVLEKLTKREAFSQIFEGSFRVDVDDRTMMKRQFELFTGVAERVPVKSLRIARDLDVIDEACAVVSSDIGL